MSTTQGQEEAVKGSIKCQDCGNQAKKDCAYSRCRSCCKNKGFECQTHIRSTWIPVDRRRQRMEQHPSPTTSNPNHLQGAGDVSKRHKQNPYSGSTVRIYIYISFITKIKIHHPCMMYLYNTALTVPFSSILLLLFDI